MADFDTPWKIIMEYFEDLMAFFYPAVHAGIDWGQPVENQESEIQPDQPESETGRLYADKVVKVSTTAGLPEFIVVHIEAQGDTVPDMPERVYIYNSSLFLYHRIPVVSLVLYTDMSPTWQPDTYKVEMLGFKLIMEFPTAKVLAYEGREQALAEHPNLFALVALAHIRAKRTREDPEGRLMAKRSLLRMLFQRELTAKKVRDLLKFIDWVLTLPEGVEKTLWHEVRQWEEVKTMYLASFEREPYQKGYAEGEQKGEQNGYAKGEQNGYAKGEQNGYAKVVTRMLAQGLDHQTIANLTGLSLDDVNIMSKRAS